MARSIIIISLDITMKTLSDGELRQLCKKYNVNINGIVNRDTLPPLKEGWTIMNLDLHTNDGTHWTCYKVNAKQPHFYMDAFGIEPPQKLHDQLGKFVYNQKEIQSMHSCSCGWFCIACIMLCEKWGNDLDAFNKFIKMFSYQPHLNEEMLKEIFKIL